MNSSGNPQISCGKPSGFTLLELLVVILIVSLISALVLPRMAASLPGVQLKSTARAVAASLRYARSKSVFESTPYVAIFDPTRKLLAIEPMEKPIEADELDSFRVILDTSKLHKVYQFPDEIELAVFDNRDADRDRDLFPILFFPRGDSTGGKIVLQNLRGRRYALTVDPITGAVEIER